MTFKLTLLMAEQNFYQATKLTDCGYFTVHDAIAFAGHTRQELSEHGHVKR